MADITEDKPEHSHYEVLTDNWGDHLKGKVLTADEVGPHHRWAVENNVIGPISAEEAAARAKANPQQGDENAIGPEDDGETAEKKTAAIMEANAPNPDDDLDTATAKAERRTIADVRRTQAAEQRQSRENLRPTPTAPPAAPAAAPPATPPPAPKE